MLNRNSSYWLKPKQSTVVPYSELAMHVGAAGRFVRGYCRTGENYAFILYGDEFEPNSTHGLIKEVLPYNSSAYFDCIKSAIVPSDYLF